MKKILLISIAMLLTASITCGQSSTVSNPVIIKNNQMELTPANAPLSIIYSTALGGDWKWGVTWIGYIIPSASDDVVIDGSVFITKAQSCLNLTITPNGTLTIKPGGSLTVDGNTVITGSMVVETRGSLITNGTIAGSATIERYIQGNMEWHILSSPVIGQSICNGVFAPTTANFPRSQWEFFGWLSNSSTPWINLRGPGAGNANTINFPGLVFEESKGYFVAYGPGWPTTKSFTGTPNTGDKTCYFNSVSAPWSWELIGNPFPSALDWAQVTGKSNLFLPYYYVYDANKPGGPGFEFWADPTHNSGAIIIDGFIPSMQGFFLQVDQAGAKSLGLPNSARAHDVVKDWWLKEFLVNKLTVKLGNDTLYDETFIMFENNGNNGKDMFDAAKLLSLDLNVPQIYSMVDNDQKTAFNSLPLLIKGVSIPLGIVTPASDSYSLTATGMESFNQLQDLSLEDRKLNYTQDLLQNPVYNFSASEGEDDNRFILHLSGPIGIGEKTTIPVNIYTSQKTVVITCNNGFHNAEVRISDLLGREILTRKLVNDVMNSIQLNVPEGYYFVRVQDDACIKNAKVYIK